MLGPNVRRLIAHKIAILAIPPGTANPLLAGLRSLTEPGSLSRNAKEATNWVKTAIAAIKATSDNPYGNDDEAIAAAILKRLAERQEIILSRNEEPPE